MSLDYIIEEYTSFIWGKQTLFIEIKKRPHDDWLFHFDNTDPNMFDRVKGGNFQNRKKSDKTVYSFS